MFGMEDKALPMLAVFRQKRGITRNVAAVGTTPGQSDTSGRSYAVRSFNADRVFHEGKKVEALATTTSKGRQQGRRFFRRKNPNFSSDLWNALEVAHK